MTPFQVWMHLPREKAEIVGVFELNMGDQRRMKYLLHNFVRIKFFLRRCYYCTHKTAVVRYDAEKIPVFDSDCPLCCVRIRTWDWELSTLRAVYAQRFTGCDPGIKKYRLYVLQSEWIVRICTSLGVCMPSWEYTLTEANWAIRLD